MGEQIDTREKFLSFKLVGVPFWDNCNFAYQKQLDCEASTQ